MSEIVLGIDLGTTNSCMAYVDDQGKQVVIINAEGKTTTPSVVSFNEDGEVVVGEYAKQQAEMYPNSTFSSVKRFMGIPMDDEIYEKEHYSTLNDKNGDRYSPQVISAYILGKLKADAEHYLGQNITKAVITVPAYFNNAQRQATVDAGKIAGLEVLHIINEPTAAAIAYGLEKSQNKNILVYDLGGGTFDISVINILTHQDNLQQDMNLIFNVVATSGDTHLGGDVFDTKIMERIFADIREQKGVDISNDPKSRQNVKTAAEDAKKRLSGMERTKILLNNLGPRNDINYQCTLSRDEFITLIQSELDKTMVLLKEAIAKAKNNHKTFTLGDVLLVGGSTRIPRIVDLVKKEIGMNPLLDINPDECVAVGAAIMGHVLINGPIEKTDRSGGIIKTRIHHLDITALDLGIVSLDVSTGQDVFSVIIEKGTHLPAEKSRNGFTTVNDYQTAIAFPVIQGDTSKSILANSPYHKILGIGKLTNIRLAKENEEEYEVIFKLDKRGILEATAKEVSTGHSVVFKLDLLNAMSEAEIYQKKSAVNEAMQSYKEENMNV